MKNDIITPDKWVLLKINLKNVEIIRIMSGFIGGYLGSDSWRLSSEVKIETIKFINDINSYEVKTYSGTTYILNRLYVGLTSLSSLMVDKVIDKYENDCILLDKIEEIDSFMNNS